jgi:hypothetical protein
MQKNLVSFQLAAKSSSRAEQTGCVRNNPTQAKRRLEWATQAFFTQAFFAD